MKNALAIIGGLLVLIALGAVVYLQRFDAGAYLSARSARFVDDMVAHQADALTKQNLVAMSRFHRGEAPCFTYQPPHISDEERDQIVSELHAANVPPGNLMVFATWSAADERERHGELTEAEMAAALELTPSAKLRDRLLQFFAGKKLLDAQKQHQLAIETSLNQRRQELERALTPAQRDGLKAIWQRHRLSLSVPACVAIAKKFRGAPPTEP